MPTNRPSATQIIRRSALSAGLLALFGIVAPIALIQIAGWPLPNSIPDAGETLTAIQQQNVPDGFVVGAFAVAAWLLWAQLAWALLWELAVNTRRLAAGIDVRPAPLVIPGINNLVARLASGTVAISIMAATPAAAAALPIAPASSVVDFAPSKPTPTSTRQATTATRATQVQWHVHEGDTGWSIAEAALGDGSRFGEILRLNSSIQTPRDISPGIALTLPDGAQIPANRSTTEQQVPKTAGGAAEDYERRTATTVHTVTPGDYLWSISETTLEERSGSRPDDAETADFLRAVVDANGEIIEDADLIYPGERFVLPGIGPRPTDATPTAAGYLPAEDRTIITGDHLWGLSEQRLEQVTGTDPSNAEILEHVNTVIDLNEDIVENPDLIYPGEVFTFPAIGDPPAAVHAIEQPPESTVPEVPGDAQEEEDAPDEVIAEPTATPDLNDLTHSANSRSVLPYLLGLAGATVLATSVLVAIRAVQRRQATQGARQRSHRGSALERTVTAAANLPLIRWAGQELSVLVAGLSADVAANSSPLAVEVSETGLELLWDSPAPDAPHPWEATDGGAAWRLLFDPDAPIPTDDLPPAMPALVTIGVRPGEGVVLLDLESLGSISVTGDETAVADLVRSLALELASGSDLASADVVTVGFDVEAQHHFPRINAVTEGDALTLVRSTVEQYDAMLADADVASSFELRCATGVGPEAVVAVVSAESCSNIDELLQTAGRRRGAAIIVVGACESASGSVSVAPDGSCTVEPIGLCVEAPAVTVQAETELTDLLEQAAASGTVDSEGVEDAPSSLAALPTDVDVSSPELEPLEQVASTSDATAWLTDKPVDLNVVGSALDMHDSWERPSAPLMIRLLGEPAASGFDLSVRQIGLLAFIASKGGEASAECVLDHLWADQSNARSRKTLWNLESNTRTLVGPEILHHSPKNQPLRTSATTDILVFEALVERASRVSSSEAVPLLADALDLVDGPPFDHSQFEWARSVGIYEPTRQMIEIAALRLCELALQAGDHDIARRATNQGLLGLGVNEPLYQARMRVEAESGDHAEVARVYCQLEERLEILFDDAMPSADTRRLRDQLLNPGESVQADKQSA